MNLQSLIRTFLFSDFNHSISLNMLIVFIINTITQESRPRVHKAFQDQNQHQAQYKHYFAMDFFSNTYYNYLTIDCWYLIKYVLQTRLLGILNFFYE